MLLHGSRTRAPAGMVAAALLLAAIVVVPRSADAVVLPSGFVDEMVGLIWQPTGIAFTPDGRVLVASKPGYLRIFSDDALLATPALNLTARICTNVERGLLGVAVDPQFSSNHYVYLYYTFKKFTGCPTGSSSNARPVNRVSRFTLPASNVIQPSSELVLIDNIPSVSANHNAGDLFFGKDDKLYVTVGDGGCDWQGGGCAGTNDAARDKNVLLGKVLRINRDGTAPATNPFTGAGTGPCRTTGSTFANFHCRETFAWGLRNPFRFAFDPNAAGTRFYINDVGQERWEEIDLGTAGADYGWSVREGPCANGSTTNCGPPPAGMTNPIRSYSHDTGCSSITGGAFVPNGLWPAEYDNTYLYADFVCGKIFRMSGTQQSGFTTTEFASDLGNSSAVHLAFGPAGNETALYYTTFADGGHLRRIVYRPAGAPVAEVSASPTSGPLPLSVSFDGSASSDPDNDPLTYLWDFGDGATATTTASATSHTYTTAGTRTASLRVRDPGGLTSPPATVQISAGNSAPVATISAPAEGATFTTGGSITLSGSAADPEEGAIPASRLSWNVLLHHNDHTHPYFGPAAGNNFTINGPAPEDIFATQDSYLEIYLTATDSAGVSTTIRRDMLPRKVFLTVATNPSGLNVQVEGVWLHGPAVLVSWVGWAVTVTAPGRQGDYVFLNWSDGGARSHDVVTPATSHTVTARYVHI